MELQRISLSFARVRSGRKEERKEGKALLVHTITRACVTVRIVAAEDDGGSGASFAKGRVGGGAIGI